ncbi:M67 family metallopeptidase [Tsuneonella sp. CC-YZS046]|nr:M67 family metallopeptidase [Tsuneonella sp. CC-YZS046]WRO68191.1 M67 family metallopeptidase [Tsuneonella sp. CC-YZS046]
MSRLAKSKSCPSTSSGRTEIHISPTVLTDLLSEAARVAPEEACGLLMGHERDGRLRIARAVAAPNVAAEPERRFEIDPRVLIDAQRAAREGGAQVVGYYHSHPAGAARPSATDREMAAHDGRVWAVVAGGEVRFWRDAANRFEPLSYRLVDG